MAYTDFIAAIDLGSSHMVGMVGTKNATGALSIIAYEVENNNGTCITINQIIIFICFQCIL